MAMTEDREQDAWSQIGALLKRMHDAGWCPDLKIRSGGETARIELQLDLFGDDQPDVYEWQFPFCEAAQQLLVKLEDIKQKVNEQWESKKI
jgi:hypothetical protein